MELEWLRLALTVPVHVLQGYLLIRMLSIRRTGWFFLSWFILIILPLIFDVPVLAFGILTYFICPVLFSKGNLLRRLLGSTLVTLAILLAEVLGYSVWVSVYGELPTLDKTLKDIPRYLQMQLIHLLIVCFLFWGLYALWQRIFLKSRGAGLSSIVPFFAIQMLSLYTLTVVNSMVWTDVAVLRTLIWLFLFCFAVDVLLAFLINRFKRQLLEAERVDFLEKQLEQQLDYYRKSTAAIEEVSRFRHDLRNQLQTVYALMEQGDLSAAQAHLDAVTDGLTKEVAE